MTEQQLLLYMLAVVVAAFLCGVASIAHDKGRKWASRAFYALAFLFIAPVAVRLWIAVALSW